jgi:hypothetical protein
MRGAINASRRQTLSLDRDPHSFPPPGMMIISLSETVGASLRRPDLDSCAFDGLRALREPRLCQIDCMLLPFDLRAKLLTPAPPETAAGRRVRARGRVKLSLSGVARL